MEKYIFIGQAAKILQCNKSLLRYYEDEFGLDIPRNQSGRRIYSTKELEMFRYIYKLKAEGQSNSNIKAVLSSDHSTKDVYCFTEVLLDEEEKSDETSVSPDAVAELFSMMEHIIRDIAELKNISQFDRKNDLVSENNELKQKLKEKTYELVETREKLNSLKKASARKLFKS